MTVPAAPIVWERVRRLTVVPFLHDGRCALIPAGDRLVLPRRLRAAGDEQAAAVVEAADRARRDLDEGAFYRDHLLLLETSYLRDGTPRGGSGFGGTAADWRAQRGHLCQAIDRDGSFLDIGCANGHLLESMVAWCAERGVRLEPFGVDLSAGLVAEARRRLPAWADRIWVGNALDWTAPGGRRFDFVHTLLDLVPAARMGQMGPPPAGAAGRPGRAAAGLELRAGAGPVPARRPPPAAPRLPGGRRHPPDPASRSVPPAVGLDPARPGTPS